MNIPAIRWILVAACLVAVAAAAGSYEDEYEDDEPAAPPPSPVKLRPSPLARQARGPIVPGRPSPKNTVTQKTTTTEAPAEYEDEEGEVDAVEGGEEDHQSTTSETPKRGGVGNGVVRPFRSNADLLETLKRRRQQHGDNKHSAASTATTTTSAPSNQEKSFKGGRRAGKSSSSFSDQAGSNSERKPAYNRNSRQQNAAAASTSEPVKVAPEEQPRGRSSIFSPRNRKL